MAHLCYLVNIGSDKGLFPVWHRAITNVDILPVWTNVMNIKPKSKHESPEIAFEMWLVKYLSFCDTLNVYKGRKLW